MENFVYNSFDERKGVGDLLYVNPERVEKYRFYRLRDRWVDCYMVEFYSRSEEYILYWGGDKQGREKICNRVIETENNLERKWRLTSFEPLLAYSLPTIVNDVEQKLTKKIENMACRYLRTARDENNITLHKCLINNQKHLNEFAKIKETYEGLHPERNVVPNNECPFAYSAECQECPLFDGQ